MLYGTIPAMEQRVYSKCKNCTRVFNPRDILSHRSCSKSHTLHSSLLKKKVKSKSSNGKKTSSNGSASSNSTTSSSPVVATSSTTSPVKDPLKDFEFKVIIFCLFHFSGSNSCLFLYFRDLILHLL